MSIIKNSVLIPNVPFHSQRLDSSNFQTEGFPTLEDARHWTPRICGLACLKMVISAFTGKTITLYELLQTGLEMNAYREKIGWIHQGLVNIAKRYQLVAGRESIGHDISKIYDHLSAGRLVIPSVSPGLEGGKIYQLKSDEQYVVPRSGHLVVVYGANVVDNQLHNLMLHHPSSEKDYEWPEISFSIDDFLKSFSEKGNIIFISRKV